MASTKTKPSWDQLYSIAAQQDGYFTTDQAREAGYSPQLIAYHSQQGRIDNVRRGIYRLVHFPAGEHEDLTVIWLWSDRKGVFSHDTALSLHELSDILPAKVHLTLPADWKTRRLTIPDAVIPHYGEVAPLDRTWKGTVPVTTPARTLNDCAQAHLAPGLVRQALEEGLVRGLFSMNEVATAVDYVRTFDPNWKLER